LWLGRDAEGLDFGNQIAQIQGRKFYDINGNGARDDGEVGIDWWTIQLVDPATGEVLATTETGPVDLNGDWRYDPDTECGWYSFAGLPPGDYHIREAHQWGDGWEQTAPVNGVHEATVVPGASPVGTEGLGDEPLNILDAVELSPTLVEVL
jgi:hypothetical protein